MTDNGLRRFDEKAVLVTGAASGIGRATVERLATEGAAVACIDWDEAGAAAAAEAATDLGSTAFAMRCDVSDEAAVQATVAGAVERLEKLDAAINMAGILVCEHTHKTSLDTWNKVIAVNLTGTFLMCREALPHLIESGGNIVNAASTSSLAGYPWFSAYASSKGGVLMLTRSIALEYAKRGVRANAVAPGGISTPMTETIDMPSEGLDFALFDRMAPVDQFRGPETVASVIAFLASEDAAHVNGEYVRCDGATLA